MKDISSPTAYRAEVRHARELSVPQCDAIWELFAANMRVLYKRAGLWDEQTKKEELFHADSRYILAYRGETLAGYVMWRYDTDPSDYGDENGLVPVAYWCVFSLTVTRSRSQVHTRGEVWAAGSWPRSSVLRCVEA